MVFPSIIQKIFTVTLILVFVFQLANGQQTESAQSSFALAKEKNRKILLVFTGSDWCAPCIRFEKKVLNDPTFIHFVDSSLILINVDFPQSKKLSEQTTKENDQLADKFNPSGSFPLIILLRPDQEVLAYLNYRNENADQFIIMLDHYCHNKFQ